MRTRIYNKMTTPEIEEYLARGGDTIFLAIGVVECHGNMPVDVETIGPEANAVLLAEKADGLALVNLPYFYPGGTVISRATIRLSVADSIDYLRKICLSLVDQGFKRIFLLSGHAPASIYINAFCRDFFEETLIHPCHLTNVTGNGAPAGTDMSKMNDPAMREKRKNAAYGAYKIMGLEQFLPVDPNAEEPDAARKPQDGILHEFATKARAFGGVASLIFDDPKQHAGGRIFKSVEERDAACAEGEAFLREQVKDSRICELKEALGRYQDYVQRVYKDHPWIRKTH